MGTTTTGEPGTQAQVTDSTGGPNHTFDFVIPRGADGADGVDGEMGPTGPTGPTGPRGDCCRCRYVADLEECANDVKIAAKLNELLAVMRECGLMEY